VLHTDQGALAICGLSGRDNVGSPGWRHASAISAGDFFMMRATESLRPDLTRLTSRISPGDVGSVNRDPCRFRSFWSPSRSTSLTGNGQVPYGVACWWLQNEAPVKDKLFGVFLGAIGLLVASVALVAHHGAASFDTTKELTLRGP